MSACPGSPWHAPLTAVPSHDGSLRKAVWGKRSRRAACWAKATGLVRAWGRTPSSPSTFTRAAESGQHCSAPGKRGSCPKPFLLHALLGSGLLPPGASSLGQGLRGVQGVGCGQFSLAGRVSVPMYVSKGLITYKGGTEPGAEAEGRTGQGLGLESGQLFPRLLDLSQAFQIAVKVCLSR